MASWWGKLGGAVLGGMVGGPVGAIIGGALGHGVDSAIDDSDRVGQEMRGVNFGCPHCQWPTSAPVGATVTCGRCHREFVTQRCDHCQTPLAAPNPGEWVCSSCGEGVSFGSGRPFRDGSDRAHEQYQGQEAFALLLTGAFALAGKLARVDGRVTPDEIAVVTRVMAELGIDRQAASYLRQVFREAKDSPHDFEAVASQTFSQAGHLPDAAQLVARLLLQVAWADGSASPEELAFIDRVRSIFRLPDRDYQELLGLFTGHRRQQQSGPRRAAGRDSLADAYRALGLEPGTSFEEVRRVYREKVRKFHPDYLSGKELDEEFHRFAQAKMAELNAAYERIRQEQGR